MRPKIVPVQIGIRKIKDVTETIFSGGTPSTKIKQYWNGGIPWLSSGETRNDFITETERSITDEGVEKSSTRLAKQGDVIVASAGQGNTRGQVSYCLINTYINQSIIALRAKSSIMETRFLYYNLKSRYSELRRLSDSFSSRGSLTTKLLADLDIPLLPLEQQKKISRIMYVLDMQILALKKQNQILERIIQSIFKSWFIDFDGQTEFVDSELGEIPKGWKVGCLGELCDFVMGQSPPGSSYNEIGKGEVFYQGITDFGNFFPYPRVYCTMPKRFALPKDILFSVRAPIGSINVANQRCCIGRGLAALRLKKNHGPFLYYLLQSTHNEWQSFEEHGTIFGAVTKNNINDFKIMIPPSELINHFNLLTNPLYAKIWNNNLLIRILTEIRDSLLPKLMSGEIKV